MSNADNVVLRKLKQDINQKNAMRREIEKLVLAVNRWNKILSKSKSFREQSKYSASIKRYVARIDSLRSELIETNGNIEKRIRETAACSDSEVDDFKSRLVQDMSGLNVDDDSNRMKPNKKKSEKKRGKPGKPAKPQKKSSGIKREDRLQKKIDAANKRLNSDMSEIGHVTGRIVKLNQGLTRVGDGDQPEELTVEKRNVNLFTQELKRVERENQVFGA